jgi:ubiquitin carboxyl-terminal hydrolase 4/11/15
MGYFVGSKEIVPTGWHTVDEDKTYPPLSSRKPELPQDTSSMSGYEVSNGRAGSEGSEMDSLNADGSANTRMNEESSDEDEDIPAIATTRVSLNHFYVHTESQPPNFFA